MSEWLSKTIPKGSAVGVDPMLYANSEWDTMKKELESSGRKLIAVKDNLIDIIWKDRPARPLNPAVLLPLKYSGKPSSEKLQDVRKEMADAGAETLVLTELDEVACKSFLRLWGISEFDLTQNRYYYVYWYTWIGLLNLRGSDIPYNPVFFAYVIVTSSDVEIFINLKKLSDSVRDSLKSEEKNVVFHTYESIVVRLNEIVSWQVLFVIV
jgi:Xaa-Pro aminopeptidase